MTYHQANEYCLKKLGAVKAFPFNDKVSVYKVGGKMFALMSEGDLPLRINVKCDPLYALELRSIYEQVIPGYHMNKKHWNTIICDGSIEDALVLEWLDDSYQLIVSALPKRVRETL